MKKYFFIFIFILPTILSGQDARKPESKIALGISFSPDYSYRLLNATDTMSDMILGYRDTTDLPKFGYIVGTRLFWHFRKRFSLETGLLFSDKGDKTKPISNFYPIVDDPLLLNVKSVSINYHEYFIDIPVKINYKLIDRKCSLFVSAGLAANIYLTTTNTSEILFKDGTTEKNRSSRHDESYRMISISGLIGLGIDYKLSSHFTARAEPTFRHSLMPVTNSNLEAYFYSVGLNCGVYYSF